MSFTEGKVVNIGGILYKIILSSDVIEAPSSKGTTKYWQGHIVQSPLQKFFTCSSAWQTKKDGTPSKVNWSDPYYANPTNVGRSNERGNELQAHFEFNAMVAKQRDKRNSENPLPMLAQSYNDRAKHIVFPAAVQPKFDGMRMLYDGTEAWSRGNKPIVPEVYAHLHFDTRGFIVDGELILPANLKLSESMSAAKKFYPGVSDQLEYRVYDLIHPDWTFEKRYDVLGQIVKDAKNAKIILVETYTVNDDDDIRRWHSDFTDRGYEGTIIRNMNGKYTINKRSNDLQKFKDFIDEEFEILDVIPSGEGSARDVGKFVCRSPANATKPTFESTPIGTYEQRHEYLVNKHKYIGKFAKVKFREYTVYGQPFHSNVIEIRDTKKGGY